MWMIICTVTSTVKSRAEHTNLHQSDVYLYQQRKYPLAAWVWPLLD